MEEVKTTFEDLYNLDVRDKVEQKNGLNYLSWAYAWAEIKKIYPNAKYNIYKFGEKQLPYVYDEKTGYMVFTDVTINDITHEMWLPVMDGANKTMLDHPYTYQVKDKKNGGFVEKQVEVATMFDVNKTIMRCLTKNLAMFGLGLSLYQGEDLPVIANVEDAKKYVVTFGKFQGSTLEEIIEQNPNYAEWLYTNTKDENIKIGLELLMNIPTQDEQEEILHLIVELNDLVRDKGYGYENLHKHYKVQSTNEMTIEQLKDAIKIVKGE